MSGGMWGGVAGGAKVVRGSTDPLQVTVEGQTVWRIEMASSESWPGTTCLTPGKNFTYRDLE